MSYPDETDPTAWPITEWLIDGVWTDLSDRVRGDISITRGRQNEQGTISPTSAIYSLNNHDNLISNRNPNSAYFRKLPLGTQTRHRAGNGDNYASMPYNTFEPATSNMVRTADAAALDIIGDMELRIDVEPHTWRPAGFDHILASKYKQNTNDRSWVAYLNNDGSIAFAWSVDGTVGTRVIAFSTVTVPATSGRLSIKITLDVNNGSGGNTVTFYTASSINGTYTQLGAPVVNSGVTSVKSGAAALVLGAGDDVGKVFTNGVTFGGRFYAFHLYNGIGGTKVADPTFSTWAIDDVSKVDSHSNLWELYGDARVSSSRLRFWGELTSITQTEDSSGNDKLVPIESADPTQGLSNSKIAAESPLFLQISQKSGLLGYWPMEDGADSEFAASGIGGLQALPKDVVFGQDAGLPGAKTEAELNSQLSNIKMSVKKGTNTGRWEMVFLFKVPSPLPAINSTLVTINTPGFSRYINFLIGPTGFQLRATGADFFTPHLDAPSGFGAGVVVAGEWIAMRILFFQNGANINWEWAWYQQGSSTFWGQSGSFAGVGVTAPTQVIVSAQATSAFSGTKVAHFVVSEQSLGFASGDTTWSSAIDAYAGELAANRIDRIARAAGIYLEITGDVFSTAALGAQPVDTPMNVLTDAARADGGVLYGLRDAFGIAYRSRQDLERHGDAALNYSLHFAEPPRVTDGLESIVNAFTASRRGGSSAVAEITTGPNSTQEPPNGVRYRPGGSDFNIYNDDTLPDLANLYARIGTIDAPRIPNFAFGLHRNDTHPSTAAGQSLMNLDIGDTAYVDGWLAHLAPDSLSFIMQGYSETLMHSLWELRFNTSPAAVLNTGTWDTTDQYAGKQRWGTGSSTLNAGITASATTITIASTAAVTTVEVFTTVSARYPLDILVNGERIRLNSAPTGGTSPQTFNGVTRAVNGVSKSHLAGVAVRLFTPTYYGL